MKECAVYAAALAGTLLGAGVAFAGDHGAAAHSEVEAAEEFDVGADVKTRGVELGEYRIRSYHLVEAQKSTVQFVLYAAVSSERFRETQYLVDNHRYKIRDQIITATRMAPLAVFDEPGLESFRRRIFLRLRRALPELTIDDVYVSEFQLTVKSL
ncbi:MAG: hypothetical protein L0228_04100 [Planctomycetes bacterium]|nr:hypothetical protein [Planctomycetota bacterium]